jgi:hypothetical protein
MDDQHVDSLYDDNFEAVGPSRVTRATAVTRRSVSRAHVYAAESPAAGGTDAVLVDAWRALPELGDRAHGAALYAAAGRALSTVGRSRHAREDDSLTSEILVRIVVAARNNPDFAAANRLAEHPVAAVRTYLNAVARSVLASRYVQKSSLVAYCPTPIDEVADVARAGSELDSDRLLAVVVAEAEKVLVDDDPEVGPRGKQRRRSTFRDRVAVVYGSRRVEDLVAVPRAHPEYARARNAVDQRFKRLMETLTGVLARRARFLERQKVARVQCFVDSLRLYGPALR